MELFFQNNIWIIILLILWVLPWKGYALWTAARKSHTGWFIAILIINTFAVLDIFYIFFIAKEGKNIFAKKKRSVKEENPPARFDEAPARRADGKELSSDNSEHTHSSSQ